MDELMKDSKKVDKRKLIPVVTQNVYIPFISGNDLVVREVIIGIEYNCKNNSYKYWRYDESTKQKDYIDHNVYIKYLDYYDERFKEVFYKNMNEIDLKDVIMIGLDN